MWLALEQELRVVAEEHVRVCVAVETFSAMIPDYSELACEDLARLQRARSEARPVRAEAVEAELCRKCVIGYVEVNSKRERR